ATGISRHLRILWPKKKPRLSFSDPFGTGGSFTAKTLCELRRIHKLPYNRLVNPTGNIIKWMQTRPTTVLAKMIKALFFYLGVFSLLFGDLLAAAGSDELAGNWKGTLDSPQVKLRLVFKFAKSASGYSGKMDSPDQGGRDIPVDKVTFKDKK